MPTLIIQCNRDLGNYNASEEYSYVPYQSRGEDADVSDVIDIAMLFDSRKSASRKRTYRAERNDEQERWDVYRRRNGAEVTGLRRRFIRGWWAGVAEQFSTNSATETVPSPVGVMLLDDYKKAKAAAGVNPQKVNKNWSEAGRRAGRNADTGRSGRVDPVGPRSLGTGN